MRLPPFSKPGMTSQIHHLKIGLMPMLLGMKRLLCRRRRDSSTRSKIRGLLRRPRKPCKLNSMVSMKRLVTWELKWMIFKARWILG